MNVSLPEPLKQFVDGKVSSGIYGSASEFVREAIREKLPSRPGPPRLPRRRLESKLLEGLRSGASTPITEDFFEKKKQALTQRLARKSKRA